MGEPGGPLTLPAMRLELLDHAALLQVPVSLDVLCELAGRRWNQAATAVSVPIRVVGAAGVQTVAAADLGRAGEELQVTLGEGPTLDVLAGADTISVDDLSGYEAAGRWPMFAPAAVQAGIRSLVVLPMRVGAARFGAFGVYLREVGGLDPTGRAEATTMATMALDLLLRFLGAGESVPGTGRPAHRPLAPDADSVGFLDERPEIHQATGMVSVQLGVDLPTALLRLRTRAFAEDRRLSHLAADVVARVVRFDEDDDADRESGSGGGVP
jgi:hypothetical protein